VCREHAVRELRLHMKPKERDAARSRSVDRGKPLISTIVVRVSVMLVAAGCQLRGSSGDWWIGLTVAGSMVPPIGPR
jgi:hypothetical protein